MALSVSYTFTPNTTILSAEVNSNFASLVAGAVDKTGDTLSGTLNTLSLLPAVNGTYDLGGNSFAYRNLWLTGVTVFNAIGYTWPATDVAGYLTSDGAGGLTWTASSTTLNFPCCGRLTLTSNTPVTTADVTAATTLYYTPYGGNDMALYNGVGWAITTFTQASIAVPATTSQMYDVYAALSISSGITLSLVAWTNDTTRATAPTTQDGVLVKTGDTSKRYLGSVRTTTVSGQTEDSVTKRFVWNYYNRVPRAMFKQDGTANWSYNTATIRQVRADTTDKVEFVLGVAEESVLAQYTTVVKNDNATVQGMQFGSSLDSITAFLPSPGIAGTIFCGPTANEIRNAVNILTAYPAVGYHYLAMLEAGTGTGVTTWYGTATYPNAATLTANLRG